MLSSIKEISRFIITMSSHNRSSGVSEEQLEDLMQSRSNSSSVPILTHRAEDAMRRQLRDVAMRGCATEIRAFADCAKDKLLSVAWKCHSLNKQVDSCMKKFKEDERLLDELRRRSAKCNFIPFSIIHLLFVAVFAHLLTQTVHPIPYDSRTVT